MMPTAEEQKVLRSVQVSNEGGIEPRPAIALRPDVRDLDTTVFRPRSSKVSCSSQSGCAHASASAKRIFNVGMEYLRATQ